MGQREIRRIIRVGRLPQLKNAPLAHYLQQLYVENNQALLTGQV